MSTERAQSDLEQLRGDESALRAKLAEIHDKIRKIEVFLEMAREYGVPVIASTTGTASPKGGRPVGGMSADAVHKAVDIIRKLQRPVHTRELLVHLQDMGLTIGGSDPAANLSGILSRSGRFENSRALGWMLAGISENYALDSDVAAPKRNATDDEI